MSGSEPRAVTLKDDRTVVLREATSGDAEAMLAYMYANLPEFHRYVLTTPDEFDYTPDQERQMIDETRDRQGLILLALTESGVIGMLMSHPQRRQRIAHVAEVGMTICDAYREVGLGSAMMAYLIAWAEAHPVVEMMQLSVYADNPRAIALYRKFDFVEAGRLPRRSKFGPEQYKDDIIMYRRVATGLRYE